jgi:hypothetical protein
MFSGVKVGRAVLCAPRSWIDVRYPALRPSPAGRGLPALPCDRLCKEVLGFNAKASQGILCASPKVAKLPKFTPFALVGARTDRATTARPLPVELFAQHALKQTLDSSGNRAAHQATIAVSHVIAPLRRTTRRTQLS